MVGKLRKKKTVLAKALLLVNVFVWSWFVPDVTALDDGSNVSAGQPPEFDLLDLNKDGQLDFGELQRVFAVELKQADWQKDEAIDSFDKSDDNQLNREEYLEFLAGLMENANVIIKAHSNVNEDFEMSRAEVVKNTRPVEPSEEARVEVTEDASVIRTQDLEGMTVVNLQAQKIGQVQTVLVSESGAVAGLVVDLTMLDTLERKSVFVSIAEIEATRDIVVWRTNMDEEDLLGLPSYEEEALTYVYF